MKKIYLLLVMAAFSFACEKNMGEEEQLSCILEMKEKFSDQLECIEWLEASVNLYSGIYNDQTVYFTNTVCPRCNTAPPTFGYTCDHEKIDFDDFSKVKNQKKIFDGCTQEFTE